MSLAVIDSNYNYTGSWQKVALEYCVPDTNPTPTPASEPAGLALFGLPLVAYLARKRK